jgi:hypothetical protein
MDASEAMKRIDELEQELEAYRQAERMQKPVWRALNKLASKLEVPLAESHAVTVKTALAALDALQAENARLKAENERAKTEVADALKILNDDVSAKYIATRAENARLREALAPFAAVYGALYRDYDNDDDPSGMTIWSDYDRQTRKSASLTVLDLREAFQALYPPPAEGA